MTDRDQYIIDNCTPVDVEEQYQEMLDDCYSPVEVAGMAFSASRILQELDPTAYRCGYNDYIDAKELIEIGDEHYRTDDVADAEAQWEETQDEGDED